LKLPEVTEDTQFGNPCFRAGKKNFCSFHFTRGEGGRRMQLPVCVGSRGQATLTFYERYSIPQFTGHNGWIELDIHDDLLMEEAENLIFDSYRHCAPQRILKALEPML